MWVMKMLRSTPSLVVEEGSDSKSMRSLEVLFTIRVETKEVFPPLGPPKANSPELPWSVQPEEPGLAWWGPVLGEGLIQASAKGWV